MTMHPAMSYRITTLEIEQAAIRAERARMAAEHADQIVHRDGILRRTLQRLQNRRATAAVVRAAAPAAPTNATGVSAGALAPTASAPVAPGVTAPAGPLGAFASATVGTESAADGARDRELVGCAPHAA